MGKVREPWALHRGTKKGYQNDLKVFSLGKKGKGEGAVVKILIKVYEIRHDLDWEAKGEPPKATI